MKHISLPPIALDVWAGSGVFGIEVAGKRRFPMKRSIRACAGSCGCFLLLLCAMAAPAAVAQPNVQGQWSTLPTLMPINPIHVALLSNGQVLVVAGSGNCPPSLAGCPSGAPYGPSNNSGALLFNPATGAITQFSVSWDMFCNGMVLLQDGRALIDGGTIQYDPFHGQQQVAVFDPSNNTFTNVQNMAHGRWYPTVLTLADGRVMAFSGLDETGGTNTAVEFYTPGSGWSQQFVAPWTPDLYPRLHLLPNGTVFYSGAQTTSKLFDPSTQIWNTNFATTNYSGTRTYGTSVLLPLTPGNNYDPKVIIMGGNNPATNTTEIIDMAAASPAWKFGPNMSQARIEMNAVILPDGRVLAIGGSVNDEDTTTASLNGDLLGPDPNNPGSYIFSSAGANAFPRLYHSVALLLPDATVWLAGGNPNRGSYVQQMEIYQPPYLFDSTGALATRPSITGAPSSISYGNTFTVQTPDSATIAHAVLVRNGTVTHAFGMDQREVEMSFTAGSGALTITAPPNGNIAPPGYYMLFLLNSSGVPSVASFVQVTPAPASPDFALAATPSSQSVPPGKSASYSVSVTASGGFTGNVTFSVTGLPTGATASFSPSSVTGSGSSTLSISTSASTPGGTYPLTITATSGSLSHSVQVTLAVADFTISASPTSQAVNRGAKTTYTIAVTAVGPFSSAVNFSVSGVPARTSASFNPTSVAGSGNSTLTISTKPKSPTGTFTLTITGTGGGATHSATVTLVIH
jgi:Domain of unknown function (DUF1929)/Glyoxal oxidase N-terminus